MVLRRFSQGKGEDVSTLIAKKNYAKAIELIKEQLKTQRSDPRLRMQLADLLVLAGKVKEAVMFLTPLADEFAREGFAAKAIAVLKKIQKIDPGRRDVDAKLATLIQEKQQQATVVASPPSGSFELGMEEIGFEPPPGGPVVTPVEERPRVAAFEPEIDLAAEPLPEPEAAPRPPAPVGDRDLMIEEAGIELEQEPEPILEPAPAAARPAAERPVIVLEAMPQLTLEPEPEVMLEPEPEIVLEPEPEPVASASPSVEPEFALDDGDEFQLDAEPGADETTPEAGFEAEAETQEAAEPLSGDLFVDELMSVLEEAFPSGLEAPLTEPIAPASGGSAQIVVSPLFRHFSVDEMVAVIAGLHLLSYERGQVIIREGDPGNSLFMLSSGKVKAFKKNAAGKQVPIAELEEGAFFGEGSILTGKPRAASIVATTQCELLELDRPTLDSIAQSQPHVMDVLHEFAAQRAGGK